MPLPVIALAGDENYAPGLFVSIASALSHLPEQLPVEVLVLDEGLAATTKSMLAQLVASASPQSKLRVLPGFGASGNRAPVREHLTAATYARLLIPQACPDAELALYLDSDILVRRDIGTLVGHQFNAHPAAAALDATVPTLAQRLQFGPLEDIDDPAQQYVNCGVMLLALSAWREQGLAAKIIRYVEDKGDTLRFLDQDAINMVLGDNIEVLDGRWNFQLRIERERGRRELPDDVALIHFSAPTKPWATAEWIRQGRLTAIASLEWWRAALCSRHIPLRLRLRLAVNLTRHLIRLAATTGRRRLSTRKRS